MDVSLGLWYSFPQKGTVIIRANMCTVIIIAHVCTTPKRYTRGIPALSHWSEELKSLLYYLPHFTNQETVAGRGLGNVPKRKHEDLTNLVIHSFIHSSIELLKEYFLNSFMCHYIFIHHSPVLGPQQIPKFFSDLVTSNKNLIREKGLKIRDLKKWSFEMSSCFNIYTSIIIFLFYKFLSSHRLTNRHLQDLFLSQLCILYLKVQETFKINWVTFVCVCVLW